MGWSGSQAGYEAGLAYFRCQVDQSQGAGEIRRLLASANIKKIKKKKAKSVLFICRTMDGKVGTMGSEGRGQGG